MALSTFAAMKVEGEGKGEMRGEIDWSCIAKDSWEWNGIESWLRKQGVSGASRTTKRSKRRWKEKQRKHKRPKILIV